VILAPATIDYWLDPENQNTDDLQELLRPCQAEWLQAWPVSPKVNSTRNESIELTVPI